MRNSFKQRRLEGELMDDPDLPRRAHAAALKGLRRINKVSRSAGALWPAVARVAGSPRERQANLLDVACGGGDVAISLALRARQAHTQLHVSACDISDAALEYAAAQAKHAAAPVEFFRLDALSGPIPRHFDIIVTTLFLHHLSADNIARLLEKLAARCDHLLVSDLARGPAGYALAWAGGHLLTSSRIVHVDALRSVRAALNMHEAEELAASAGLEGARFERQWPQRFLMHWQRPEKRREAVPS